MRHIGPLETLGCHPAHGQAKLRGRVYDADVSAAFHLNCLRATTRDLSFGSDRSREIERTRGPCVAFNAGYFRLPCGLSKVRRRALHERSLANQCRQRLGNGRHLPLLPGCITR